MLLSFSRVLSNLRARSSNLACSSASSPFRVAISDLRMSISVGVGSGMGVEVGTRTIVGLGAGSGEGVFATCTVAVASGIATGVIVDSGVGAVVGSTVRVTKTSGTGKAGGESEAHAVRRVTKVNDSPKTTSVECCKRTLTLKALSIRVAFPKTAMLGNSPLE